MIKINLLGQARPKAQRSAVPLEAAFQLGMLLLALGAAIGALGLDWWLTSRKIDQAQKSIDNLKRQKAELDQIKQEVDAFEKQKQLLQQRINVIEQLQRNRTGGQELLDAVANTVGRTETLWLTALSRKGETLTINGTAGSINAVAEYITQLKRSGYFQQIEIKETHQNGDQAVQLFDFTINANFAPPQSIPTAAPAPATQLPAKKG